MKLLRTTEYTLRSLAYLVKHSDEEKVLVKDIATKENMPYHYIGKLLQQMRKFGFVESWKGRGGGFRITEHAKECSILEIINAVQGDVELNTKMFEFEDCSKSEDCHYCRKWRFLNEQITILLMTQKVKDLAN